jgi:homoserine dehydrogenase
MKTVKIILCGCGGVGKSFLQLIADRGGEIKEKYGLRLVVSAAVDYRGAAVADSDAGLPVAELVDFIKAGNEVQTFKPYGKEGITGAAVIAQSDADVMVETTPTNLTDGGAAKGHVFGAIDRGMEIVSANKGPFVLFYKEVFQKAKEKGCGLHISAAAAAALPTLDVGLTCLAGTHVSSIEGILNGTTNYILSKMRNNGTAYDVALKEAQDLGIAETNPGYDVEGKDTANKTVLIANRVFGKTFSLADITVKGITEVTPEDIKDAAKDGKVIKLIGNARMVDGDIKLSVAPKVIDGKHPLAAVNGSEKAITYMTDTMGSITVSGGKSAPVGAAAAVLKDLINAFK